jgi:hypothetical protein
MRRKLFHLTVAVLLLLCIITAAPWVRSYWRSDAITLTCPAGTCLLQWVHGELIFGGDNVATAHIHVGLDSSPVKGRLYPLGSGAWARCGFAVQASMIRSKDILPKMLPVDRLPMPPMIYSRFDFVPICPLLLLFGILPAVAAALSLRKRRRRRSGRCEVCGYDLRASSERCPECGTVVRRTLSTAG